MNLRVGELLVLKRSQKYWVLVGLACSLYLFITWMLRAWFMPSQRGLEYDSGQLDTSRTAQGRGGSFKDRTPIGEVGCCDAWMAERIDGPKGG